MPLELRKKEKIIVKKRRHWIVLLSEMMIVFFLVLASFVSAYFLNDFFGDNIVTLLFLVTMLMVSLIIAFHFLADYYLDIWIVTDQRSLRVELKGLFHRSVKSIDHDKIQDIRVTVKGILPTLLDYGDVRIQTAGANADFIFKQIPKPYIVKEKISSASRTSRSSIG